MLRTKHSLSRRSGSNRTLRLERLEHREMLCCHDAAPVITLDVANTTNDYWRIQGTVTDKDDAVAGLSVQFGGVLAKYDLSATVGADGTYSLTQKLPDIVAGMATAQTHDTHGVNSNVATEYIISENVANSMAATPAISGFSAQNTGGDNWKFSGQVAAGDASVGGLHVKFGGVLAKYHLAATVQADGSFSLTKRLSDLSDGEVTAKIDELPDQLSDLATDSVITNDLAPVLSDFQAVNLASDLWTFSGKVSDADDGVAGRKVVLGGDLARYHLTATVRKDGTFSLTKHLRGLTGGAATALIQDVHGKSSELTTCGMVSTDAIPVISDFQAVHGDGTSWTFSGKVTDMDDRMVGRKVVFGGVLAQYNLTASVRRDGTFYVTKRLPGLLDGLVTVQIQDRQGKCSELAVDSILAQDIPV
jgi:hypothetical protein